MPPANPTQEPGGNWFPLDAEVVMENGQIVRTQNPTGHSLLVEYKFEAPCGETGGVFVYIR